MEMCLIVVLLFSGSMAGLVDKTYHKLGEDIPDADDFAPEHLSQRLGILPTVAFSAGLTHSLANLGAKQNIVFDRVDTNFGNAYNEHHGVFVAPVCGLYVFHITIMTPPNKLAYCRIAVNDVNKADVYVQGTSVYNAGSQMIVTQLHKGDYVAVQAMSQSDYVHGHDVIFSTFSGFLLQNFAEC